MSGPRRQRSRGEPLFSPASSLDPPHGQVQRGRLRGAVQVALRRDFAYHTIRALVNRPSGECLREKCGIYAG